MKFFRSVIFVFAFLFLTATPLFALACQYDCPNHCIDATMCPDPNYDATCTPNAACNPGYQDCSCKYNGGGGGGGGGGGELSTNIDAQAQGFFAYQSFDKFLPNLLQIALILGAIAAFAFLIWGAIDYIISGGNQERVKTSKTMIGNALAGLAILAAAWVIWRLITYFLGLSSTIKGPFDIKLPTP